LSKLIQTASCSVLILGVTLDQLSTKFVLQFPGIYEANPTTVWLMSMNLWLPLDVIIVLISMLATFLPSIKFGHKPALAPISTMFITYNLVFGILRLACGMYNLTLLM